MQHFELKRRDFIRRATRGAAAFAAASSLPLVMRGAGAAGDDYKALVCLFLYGGNDGLNTIPPLDAARHAQYASVRGGLALPRSQIVPLNADYGLHPGLAPLTTAWQDGALAPVFNVGPLFAPLTKAQYINAAPNDPLIPDSLFSHSDQQVLWESSSTKSLARTGWGGRASEVLGATNPVISFGGNARFGLTNLNAPWVLPGPGDDFGAAGFFDWAPVQARLAAMQAIQREPQAGPLAEEYARTRREAFDLSTRLRGAFDFNPDPAADPSGVVGAFAPLIVGGQIRSYLAQELYQVARFVALRSQVQGTRQIFFVQLGGFDNHAEQIAGDVLSGDHADLMAAVGSSVAAFWRAIKALGMQDKVTLFTQSDFGRTLQPNDSSGTDHAWGNQQFVLGGAVNGGRTHGTYPELVLGGRDDVGVEDWEKQGRFIPTISVDQYAATLLRWWGLSEGQLDQALPNLVNFGSARNVGFMKT
jgi:uncharacterized protein (DUF1501 family)